MPPTPSAPALVVVAGLVASGKSTLSRDLAERLGAPRLEADRVRGTLLAAVESESESAGAEARWRRDLSQHFEDEIYADLVRRADEALAAGRPLVLDACFPRRSQRRAVRALAARHALPFLFVECRIPDDTLRARLAERDRVAGAPVWEALHRRLAAHAEPPDELEPGERIVVCSDGPTEPELSRIEEKLRDVSTPRLAGRAFDPSSGVRPRVVSFDCWSTLLTEEDWPWAHSLRVMALRDAAREAGRDISIEAAERAFNTAWRRHMALWEKGEISSAVEIASWSLQQLELADASDAVEHLVRRFEEASHTSRVVALDGAPGLLAALEAAGTPCVLVCDTGLTPGRVVRRLLDRAGLLTHLRVLAFSDEVGAPKPDPRPFLAALEPLGVAPEHVLHVGDLRRTDVAGARALGMQTARIRARHDDTTEHPDADWIVDSHAELAGLLGLPIGDEGSTPER
jgi:putative hydrolase of the HAD superfamily